MNKDLETVLRHTAMELGRPDPHHTASGNADFAGFRREVEHMTDSLIAAMFPDFAQAPSALPLEERRTCYLQEAAELLRSSLNRVLPVSEEAEEVLLHFFEKIPEVSQALKTDLNAAYEGDPAAKSTDEIILSYPAFPAISTYRIAHILYLERVPLIPRMMTEYAHRTTGIDIHPGASIADYFFIDHGTGVVIGETTTIGEHVKIYQHVTLGAKSFDVQDDGTLVKGIKRHPDIGNHVVIYAGATILGGNTKIGDNCVIGGNVWLTHSITAGKTVLARSAVMGDTLQRDNVPYTEPTPDTQKSMLSAML